MVGFENWFDQFQRVWIFPESYFPHMDSRIGVPNMNVDSVDESYTQW
jgi:hypothetical protein